jgi:hypothetical protein
MSDRLGVEIELEGVGENDARLKPYKYWQVKEDGSLRDGGIEYVFNIPHPYTTAIKALDELYERLDKVRFNISCRTGTHVHVDARDLNVKALRVLCFIYAAFERELFNWVGDGRHQNMYCLPWYAAQGDIPNICTAVMGISTKNSDVISQARYLHRYSALNLQALNKFGSIEFRHLLSTKNKARIVEWINLIVAMRAFARDNQDLDLSKTIVDIIALNNKNELKEKVFGNYANLLTVNEEPDANVFAVLQNLVASAHPPAFTLAKLKLI